MSTKRTGFYCWAGPGTVRMIKLKYFDPQIDEASVLGSYEYEYLQGVQEKFGVTDAWVSYSWGFADHIEAEDKAFTLSKLENFKRLGIKTHAYIQGPNLVYTDFAHKDWWARDKQGNLISYHRGRKVVCINNPEFQEYILDKVTEMVRHDFDGIFMDNIQMGQLGVPHSLKSKRAFFGCNCAYCNQLFELETGFSIKEAFRSHLGRQRYLEFRVSSTTSFIAQISQVVRGARKEFGTNSFDPKFEMHHVYGTDLEALQEHQDYLLFENHSLPVHNKRNNHYIHTLIEERALKKPVFVVSYKKGIGFDASYSQEWIDRAFSEAHFSHFHLCLKGSEYVSDKKWHNLVVETYASPRISDTVAVKAHQTTVGHRIKIRVHIHFLSHLLPYSVLSWLFTGYMEKKTLRKGLGWLQVTLLK